MAAARHGSLPWPDSGQGGCHETATPALQARALGFLFTGGPTLALLSLVFPGPETNKLGILALIALAYVVAAIIWVGAGRHPLWFFPLALAIGSTLITGGIYFQGNGTGFYAFFYLWVCLYAFYFHGRAHALGQLAFIALAYGVLIAAVHPSAPIERWLIVVGTLLVAGELVRTLREQVHGLVDELTDAARTDLLTGLLNRRGFEEAFDRELARVRRSGDVLTLLVGDLDHFKRVNDRFGHEAGDETLRRAGAVLRASVREGDLVARVGGEEFAFILPQTDEGDAHVFAERVRATVQAAFVDRAVPVTMSVGIASFPRHGDTRVALLRAADQALHAAKELGRDRTVIHGAEVACLLSELQSSFGIGGQAHLTTVLTLAEALDVRDTGTARHSQTVGRYAAMMAEVLGLSRSRVERVRLAGTLHDVGKIGVADSMLRKPGPLTDEESTEMRKHPEIGARLLGGADVSDIRTWVLAHHERPDGSGYPYGLSGNEIPLEAAILAVADAYEAMTTDRPYRSALPPSTAREELRRGAGTQFAEPVVEAFLEILEPGAGGVQSRSLVATGQMRGLAA